jgi:hypothetical protein
MAKWLGVVVLAACTVSACGPSTPTEARIENIQDAADMEAHSIQAESGNEVTNMRSEAESLADQAEASNGFDAERLRTRAEALRKEAKIIERQADAEARAVKDKARAEVSAIRAQ